MSRIACAFLWLAAAGASLPELRQGQPCTLRVPFWVQTAHGEPAPPISVRDLSVEVRGHKLKPDVLLGPKSDLFLLIGLDLTGDAATAEDAKDALVKEIAKLQPRTYVSVFNCQDELRVVQEPTLARDRWVQAVQSVAAIGKPGLLNCIERVESIGDAILARSAVRVGVLFISDADVQNYRQDLINPVINSSDPNDISRRFPEHLVQDAMATLSKRMAPALAPLEIVQLTYLTDRWNEAYYDGLRAVTENTMGEAQYCVVRAAIPAAIEHSLARLIEQYSVRITAPSHGDSMAIELKTSAPGAEHPMYRSRFTLRLK
jgi:hypothetical protein